MVSHQPAKFGGHRHCGIEDTFLVVAEQDSTCPCLNPPLLFTSEVHGMPCSHAVDLLVCPMEDSRSWSRMSTRTTDGN